MRPQIVLLEHHTDVLAQLADGFVRRRFGKVEMVPGDVQRAGTRHLQQVKNAQQRAFSGTAWAEQHQRFPLRAIQRDVEQRLVRAVEAINAV